MAGLAAVLSPSSAPRTLHRLLRAQDPRGPAARTERVGPPTAPSALGLTGAPDALGEAGPWCVVVEGVLLNARPLREELHALGLLAEGAGPGAILAALLASLGWERALARVEGNLAILAIHTPDTPTATLYARRDRSGVRQLWWVSLPQGGFAFVTDPSALSVLDPASHDALPNGLLPGATHTFSLDGGLQPPPMGEPPPRPLSPDGWAGAPALWARSLAFAADLAIGQRVSGDTPIAVWASSGQHLAFWREAVGRRRRQWWLIAPHGTPAPALPQGVGWHTLPEPYPDINTADRAAAALAADLGAERLLSDAGLEGLFPAPSSVAARVSARLRRRLRGSPVTGAPDALALATLRDHQLPAVRYPALDAAAGACGLELELPFADPALVALVCTIPIAHLRQLTLQTG